MAGTRVQPSQKQGTSHNEESHERKKGEGEGEGEECSRQILLAEKLLTLPKQPV